MRHYLIIAMDIDLSAPGIVYGKLLKEMQKTCELTILCPSVGTSFQKNVTVNSCLPYKHIYFKLEKLLFRFWGRNIKDSIWAKKVYEQVKGTCLDVDYDGIISFTANNYFAPLYLGKLLKESLNKLWIVYSVDAIPAPLQWSPNRKVHINITKQLQKTIQLADAFYSANPIMLKYELGLFGDFNGNTGVVLTPHDYKEDYKHTKHDGFNFLYTGNIYGPRKVDALVAAFEKFSKQFPKSRLTFVGKFYSTIKDEYRHLIDEGKVVIHGFTNNLTSYYETADVLIEIAAVHSNDVFLSSKVINYLPMKMPIIAISGSNSPVRLLLGGVPSILHCHHDEAEIYEMLCKSTRQINSDFSDRDNLVQKFAVDTVVADFLNSINNLTC